MNDANSIALEELQTKRNKRVGVACFSAAVAMVGLAYASVPLYDLFCKVTGYGGTTQIAESAPEEILERTMKIRFDANVNNKLPWVFKPVQNVMEVHVGENKLAFYEATNTSDRTITGTATFNVSPLKVGAYFTKIDCFCFTEQVLEPGQTVDMPVSFYVDPEIQYEANLDDVTEITLSYTFFEKKAEEDETQVSSNVNTKLNTQLIRGTKLSKLESSTPENVN
jgi:cytochrome c oxidase assembly protein subunit 11